ncbi:unnamed protein product [Rotaria sp. Silwood1]|nr:unnamed protein product [Rotaria sp. Silwood1]CAF0967208.1 unnamed protein product [Rotaria sp. Silwood1]CAF0976485.1 unnamed protein product [Rotaria sp. Silwood1]CAF3381806.1 unnamed protein product [Rotaria sp. Silwood1]CAF3405671.1 unnamed protein product [Rotaria sp. Silwood1]
MTDSLLSRPQTSHFTIAPYELHKDSFIFANGDRYDGEYIITNEGQVMRHGHGKHIGVNQQYIYEGSWNHDKMHGTGQLTFANGTSYKGEFQSNFYHGIGIYTWSDGTQYKGLWHNSKPIGKAEYFDSNLGASFIGMVNEQGINMRYKLDRA